MSPPVVAAGNPVSRIFIDLTCDSTSGGDNLGGAAVPYPAWNPVSSSSTTVKIEPVNSPALPAIQAGDGCAPPGGRITATLQLVRGENLIRGGEPAFPTPRMKPTVPLRPGQIAAAGNSDSRVLIDLTRDSDSGDGNLGGAAVSYPAWNPVSSSSTTVKIEPANSPALPAVQAGDGCAPPDEHTAAALRILKAKELVRGSDGAFCIQGMNPTLRLKPHQITGLHWMLSRESAHQGSRGGILADSPGLGKTAIILSLIACHPPQPSSPQATLIVVPSGLLVRQWMDEVQSKCDGRQLGPNNVWEWHVLASRAYAPLDGPVIKVV